MKSELIIQNGTYLYQPAVEDEITWQTDLSGTPGELKFKVIGDKELKLTEGNPVRFKFDGKNVFYGFCFTRSGDKEKILDVTAFDQLRYLKNKDTYAYTNKTAGEFLKMVAKDFNLKTGTIENTNYKIPSRVEENTALIDMIQNAIDLTLQHKEALYVLYDDFGKLCLKNIKSMQVDLLIDEETGENYDYKSSIDSNTYNKIKLTYDNDKTGKREVYIAQDSKNINNFGVLQYFEKLQKDENGKAKANALLKLYNQRTRNLNIKKAFGDTRVRAGSLIGVNLNLGEITVKNQMLVTKAKHTFSGEEHYMDLTLRGGEFVV